MELTIPYFKKNYANKCQQQTWPGYTVDHIQNFEQEGYARVFFQPADERTEEQTS